MAPDGAKSSKIFTLTPLNGAWRRQKLQNFHFNPAQWRLTAPKAPKFGKIKTSKSAFEGLGPISSFRARREDSVGKKKSVRPHGDLVLRV